MKKCSVYPVNVFGRLECGEITLGEKLELKYIKFEMRSWFRKQRKYRRYYIDVLLLVDI